MREIDKYKSKAMDQLRLSQAKIDRETRDLKLASQAVKEEGQLYRKGKRVTNNVLDGEFLLRDKRRQLNLSM